MRFRGPQALRDRHQRHQGLCWPSYFRSLLLFIALYCCWRQGVCVFGLFRFSPIITTSRKKLVARRESNYGAWNAIVPRLTVVPWAAPCTATWAATGLLPTSPPFPLRF